MSYVMNLKHRSKMCIVDLNAAHFVGRHESNPSWKDGVNFV